jgi:hypothetical protein
MVEGILQTPTPHYGCLGLTSRVHKTGGGEEATSHTPLYRLILNTHGNYLPETERQNVKRMNFGI